MSTSTFVTGLLFGLLSSLHCAQMCGPIVLAYSLPMGPAAGRARLVISHLAYNGGRIVTYVVLGIVAGFAGGTVSLLGRLTGIANAAAIGAGVLLIVSGVAMFGVLPGTQRFAAASISIVARFVRPLAHLFSSSRPGSKAGLGLALGFLPCGLSYVALLKAMATASPMGGALTMFGFGLGTGGTLLVVGLFSSTLGRVLAPWRRTFVAAAVTIMGLLVLWRGVMPLLETSHPPHCPLHENAGRV